MLTTEQFTTAMRTAVEKRGGDFRYPSYSAEAEASGYYAGRTPTYRNDVGEATCLIGAAMQEAGLALPAKNNRLGATRILALRVPEIAVVGARIAQVHQDQGKPWAEALALYEHVVTMPEGEYDASGWMIGSSYQRACRAVLGTEGALVHEAASVNLAELTAQMNALTKSVVASQAAIEKAMDVPEVVAPWFAELNPYKFASGGMYVNPFLNQSMPVVTKTVIKIGAQKKEHALVA